MKFTFKYFQGCSQRVSGLVKFFKEGSNIFYLYKFYFNVFGVYYLKWYENGEFFISGGNYLMEKTNDHILYNNFEFLNISWWKSGLTQLVEGGLTHTGIARGGGPPLTIKLFNLLAFLKEKIKKIFSVNNFIWKLWKYPNQKNSPGVHKMYLIYF